MRDWIWVTYDSGNTISSQPGRNRPPPSSSLPILGARRQQLAGLTILKVKLFSLMVEKQISKTCLQIEPGITAAEVIQQ
jgi:hypothetical protein